jgi:uncharacterized membrane protein
MRNPVIYYVVIALGVIALAVGVYYLAQGGHPVREYAGLGVGVVLLIAGIAGMFMTRSKASVAK